MKKIRKKRKISKKLIIIGLLVIGLSVGLIKFLMPTKANGPIENNGEKTTLIEKPKSGKPSDYSNLENLFIAAYVVQNANSFEAHTEGKALGKSLGVSVNQIVNDKRAKQGNFIFTEAISYSNMKSVAEERYFASTQVLVRTGKVKSATEATWKDQVSSMDYQGFDEEYGSYPTGIHKYLLTENTILSSTFDGIDHNGNYVFSYEVDPSLGPSYFAREVKHMSGSSIYPTFHYCRLTLTIKENWEPVSVRTMDNYDVKTLGLDANCSSDLLETFDSFNQDNKLPYQDYFEKYLENGDLINNGGNNDEKDATEYLALGFAKYLASESDFKANVSYDNKVMDATITLNILKNQYKLNLNDALYIEYKNDNLYIKSDLFSGYIESKPFMEAIPKDLSSSSQSTSSFDLASILEKCVIKDDGTNIEITMPIELYGISCNVVFNMHYLEDKTFTLDNLKAEIAYNNYHFSVFASPQDEVQSFPDMSSITNNLSGMSELIQPLMDIVLDGSCSGTIQSSIPVLDQKLEINGSFNLDKNKAFSFQSTITYKEISYPLEVIYLNNKVYFSFLGSNTVLSNSEWEDYLLNLSLPKELPDLKDVSSSLKNMLLSITYQDSLEIIIKNVLAEDLEINLGKTASGILLSTSFGNIEVMKGSKEIVIDETKYESLDGISSLIEQVIKLSNQDISLSLDLTLPLLGKNVSLTGDIVISKSLTVYADLMVNYDTLSEKISFTYKDKYIYLNYSNIKIKYEVNSMIDYLTNLLKNQEMDTSILSNLLLSIKYQDGLSVLLKNFISDDILIQIKPVDNGILVNTSLGTISMNNIETNPEVDLDSYLDFTNIIDIDVLTSFIQSDSIQVSLEETSVLDRTISMDLKLSLKEQFYLDGIITIDGQVLNLQVNKESFFISYKDNSMSGKNDDLLFYLPKIKELLSLQSLNLPENLSIPELSLSMDEELTFLIKDILTIIFTQKENELNVFLKEYGSNLVISKGEQLTDSMKKGKIQFESLLPIIDTSLLLYENDFILVTLNEKKINENDLQITYSGSINLNTDKLQMSGNLNLTIQNNTDAFVLNGLKIAYENQTFYLSYQNIHLKGTLTELTTMVNFLVTSLNISFGNPDFSISFLDGLIIYLTNMTTLRNDEVISKSNMKITLSSQNEQINVNSNYFNITLEKGTSFTVSTQEAYEDLGSLNEILPELLEMINGKAITISDLSFIMEINGTTLEITDSSITYDYSNGLQGFLTFQVMSTIHTISFSMIKKQVRIEYGNSLGVSMSFTEISDLIDYAKQTFNINLSIPKQINYLNILSGLKLDKGILLSLNLSDFVKDLKLDVSIIKNDGWDISVSDIKLSSITLKDIACKVTNSPSFTPVIDESFNYKRYVDCRNIIFYVKEIMNLAKNKKFTFTINTALAMTTYQNELDKTNYSVNTRTISSTLKIEILSNNRFNIQLGLYIKEISQAYKNNALSSSNTMEHWINFIVADDTVYCTYYSDKGSKDNPIKLKMDVPTLMTVVKTVGSIFNMDIPFIDQIDSLDTSILDQIKPEIKLENMDISKYLKDINSTDNFLSITIPKTALGSQEDLIISLQREGGKFTSIFLNDFVKPSKKSQVALYGTTIAFNTSLFEAIASPSDKDKYDDFSNVDDFLKSILETAKLKEVGFNISGDATISVIGYDISIPITIKVEVDSNGMPIVYAKLDIKKPGLDLFGLAIKANTVSEIYYKDGIIYTARTISGNTEYQKMSMKYFGQNAIEEVIYLFNFGSAIANAIRDTKVDENYPRRLDTVYKSYIGSYDISLSGANLAQNSSIGDINVHLIENSNHELYRLNGDVKLVSIITGTFDLEVKNITNKEKVTITIPSKDFTYLG